MNRMNEFTLLTLLVCLLHGLVLVVGCVCVCALRKVKRLAVDVDWNSTFQTARRINSGVIKKQKGEKKETVEIYTF
jgi:hypothetical protein